MNRLTVIGDRRIATGRPKIFACTHIGGDDVQRAFEAIREHAYLFIGDPKELYWDAVGIVLRMNGAICFETYDKTDRKIAYRRAVELLKKGGNLLIYPEGAWNITEHLPVMELYRGTARMALESEADIVPVAIEQYGKRFFVNLGRNITMDGQDWNAEMLTEQLRNELATLKWEIWERRGVRCRRKMKMPTAKEWAERIVARCAYSFTVADVLDTMYESQDGDRERLAERVL